MTGTASTAADLQGTCAVFAQAGSKLALKTKACIFTLFAATAETLFHSPCSDNVHRNQRRRRKNRERKPASLRMPPICARKAAGCAISNVSTVVCTDSLLPPPPDQKRADERGDRADHDQRGNQRSQPERQHQTDEHRSATSTEDDNAAQRSDVVASTSCGTARRFFCAAAPNFLTLSLFPSSSSY